MPRAPKVDLYEREVNRFRETLALDVDSAGSRFGFTLIHSLPQHEKAAALRSFGFQPKAACDFFNLGVAAAKDGDWAEAAKQFEKAIEADNAMADAYHNFALCLEKGGMIPKAKVAWEAYIQLLPAGEERNKAKEHLASLGR